MESAFPTTNTFYGDQKSLLLRPERASSEILLFQCEVMFGSPSSNCGGNGICKIVAKRNHPQATFTRINCGHAKALFAAQGGSVSLIFPRGGLCSNLMRRHFRHGILEMPEPCPIPPEMATALRLNIRELPAGLHLIEDHKTHFQIKFNLVDWMTG